MTTRTLHVCDTWRRAQYVFRSLDREGVIRMSNHLLEAGHSDGSIERVVRIDQFGDGLDQLRGSQWNRIEYYHGDAWPGFMSGVYEVIESLHLRSIAG